MHQVENFYCKIDTLVDKMLSYSVYFEIKHQNSANMCIFVEYMCVCVKFG